MQTKGRRSSSNLVDRTGPAFSGERKSIKKAMDRAASERNRMSKTAQDALLDKRPVKYQTMDTIEQMLSNPGLNRAGADSRKKNIDLGVRPSTMKQDRLKKKSR